MALKDLLERPPGITCEKYVRGTGKRCMHYASNGACALPDEFMCVEWLKVNGPRPEPAASNAEPAETNDTPEPPPSERDLFGNRIARAPPQPAKAPATTATIPMSASPPPLVDIDSLRGLTSDDIASFKALGIEICLRSETYGDLWLVPAYTGQPRKELTPEHAATVLRVLAIFPGSQVVAFEKDTKATPPAAKENRS